MNSKSIIPYNRKSRSARNLAKLLNLDFNSVRPLTINWGNGKLSDIPEDFIIFNKPEIISRITNKKYFFEDFSKYDHIRLPPWTTKVSVASDWVKAGKEVVSRLVLQGSSGRGIRLSNEDGFENGKLFTQYVKKQDEYRVHVANVGNKVEVIDVQKKGIKKDTEPSTWKIRNVKNGFIFIRNNISVPDDVMDQALATFHKSGLDFGAVDVIYNAHSREAWVLEINTAPGLMNTTLQNYTNTFQRMLAEA